MTFNFCVKTISASLATLLLAVPALADTEQVPVCERPEQAAPTAENQYEVLRNGKAIGTHTLSFYKSDDAFRVVSQTKMKVKVLFVSAFKYDFLSDEVWCGGKISLIDTVVDDNGRDVRTEIRRGETGFDISLQEEDKPAQTLTAPLEAYPTNHWDKVKLQAPYLLNTIKGIADPSTVTECAEPDTVNFKGECFTVNTEYEYSTYYDANGHWQGMSFYKGKNNFIEFRCVDCSNTIWLN